MTEEEIRRIVDRQCVKLHNVTYYVPGFYNPPPGEPGRLPFAPETTPEEQAELDALLKKIETVTGDADEQ